MIQQAVHYAISQSKAPVAITLATLGLTIAAMQPTYALTLTYPDFSQTTFLQLNGDAHVVGSPGVLRLTDSVPGGQAGSAFTTDNFLINAHTDISTQFTFQITGGPSGGGTALRSDGLAFVIQNDDRGAGALGGAGGSISYGDDYGSPTTPANRIQNALAVEFDTYDNPGDPSDSHVAITTVNNDGTINHLKSVNVIPDLDDGNLKYAWIDMIGYGVLTSISVYLSENATKPLAPIL